MQQIQTFMKEHEPSGYPLRDLMKALVRSPVVLDR
jgi:hypothetical protein